MTPEEANKIAVSITEKYYQPGSGVTYVEAISDALLKAAEAGSIAGAEDMRVKCLNEFSRWIRSSTATSYLDLVHSIRALTPNPIEAVYKSGAVDTQGNTVNSLMDWLIKKLGYKIVPVHRDWKTVERAASASGDDLAEA